MSDSFIIEVDDLAAGILVREGASFAFHAAANVFFAMQGMIFEGPASAEWAARKLLRGGRAAAVAVKKTDQFVA